MATFLLVLTSVLVAVGSCARLDTQYLPPRPGGGFGSGVGGAGGHFGSGGLGAGGFGGSGAGGFGGSGAGGFGGSGAGGYGGSHGGGPHIPILRFENVNNGDGTYHYSYETANGITAQESGAPRAPGPEGLAVTAEGAFSFRTPDGQQLAVTYTADENGFHPSGQHLPTPPPIPEAILRSIEFNQRHPSSGGSYSGGGGSGFGGYHY